MDKSRMQRERFLGMTWLGNISLSIAESFNVRIEIVDLFLQ